MLSPYRTTSLALQLFVLPAALLVGCVVNEETTDVPVGTTSNSGSGGSGGSGGTGGSGGAGGQGGQGGAGGAGCVTADGTGQTVTSCDEMNIAPAQGAPQQCGPNLDEDPIGYRVCTRGFSIFAAGHAENLQSCLSFIGVQNACDLPPAQDCLTKMYADACVSQDIVDACAQIATSCGGALDQAQCSSDLNPFSEIGLNEIVDCMNAADPMLTCQEAYDACYPVVLTF